MPLSGAFTKESRAIYELVFKMQEECLGMLKAGVKWEDVHVRAHEVAIEGLLELGILKGGSKKEILDRGTSVAFFPHGLGHYLGMDVRAFQSLMPFSVLLSSHRTCFRGVLLHRYAPRLHALDLYPEREMLTLISLPDA